MSTIPLTVENLITYSTYSVLVTLDFS